MPWIGLKSDRETPGAIRLDPAIRTDRVRCQAFEVWNGTIASSAVAAMTTGDPTIGNATPGLAFQDHDGNGPNGNRMPLTMRSLCDLM